MRFYENGIVSLNLPTLIHSFVEMPPDCRCYPPSEQLGEDGCQVKGKESVPACHQFRPLCPRQKISLDPEGTVEGIQQDTWGRAVTGNAGDHASRSIMARRQRLIIVIITFGVRWPRMIMGANLTLLKTSKSMNAGKLAVP